MTRNCTIDLFHNARPISISTIFTKTIRNLVYPPKFCLTRLFPISPGCYSPPKRDRKQRLCKIWGVPGGRGGERETRCIMVFVKMVNSFIFIFLFYFISFAKKKRTNKQKERLQGHRNSCGQLQRVQILKKKKKFKKPSDTRKTTNSHIHTSY